LGTVKLVGETAVPGAAERAATLFSDIAAGNWHQARADFTDRMKSAVDEEELAAAWAHVTAQAGAYQGAGKPAAAQAGGLTNVSVRLRFDACVMEGCAAFDAQGSCGARFTSARSSSVPALSITGGASQFS
jgi:hypothetical protein